MSPAERRELIRRLARPVDDLGPSHRWLRRTRELRILLLVVSSVALVPWIAYLAVSLPPRYVAHNWDVTWVGFDVLLLVLMVATAVLGYLRRQMLVLTAFATGVLLICDAWFDVLTAHGDDQVWSVVTAARRRAAAGRAADRRLDADPPAGRRPGCGRWTPARTPGRCGSRCPATPTPPYVAGPRQMRHISLSDGQPLVASAATRDDAHRPGADLGSRELRRLNVAMLFAALAAFGLLYSTQALLPAIGADFGVGPTAASLTVSAATGALALAILPLSSLAESRRPGAGDAGRAAGRLPVHVRGRRRAVLLGAAGRPRPGRGLAGRGRRGRGRAPRRRGAPGRAAAPRSACTSPATPSAASPAG